METKAVIGKFKSSALALLMLAAFVVGGFIALRESNKQNSLRLSDNSLPLLTLYTSPAVTTPQIPFWSAKQMGLFDGLFGLNVEFWKDPETLQSLLLAGKGDLWIGHIEGFARAKSKGAPITLLAVTGWKKFYLLSRQSNLQSFSDLGRADSDAELAYTPPGSPSVPLLHALLADQAQNLRLSPYEPKQLTMLMLQGKIQTALVPEPIVSVLLSKIPDLRIVANVEENFCQKAQCPNRVPLAGLAANSALVENYPTLVNSLINALMRAADEVQSDNEKAINSLPAAFHEVVAADTLGSSLKRDLILVKPANEVRDEIEMYLSIVTPELLGDNGQIKLNQDFIFR